MLLLSKVCCELLFCQKKNRDQEDKQKKLHKVFSKAIKLSIIKYNTPWKGDRKFYFSHKFCARKFAPIRLTLPFSLMCCDAFFFSVFFAFQSLQGKDFEQSQICHIFHHCKESKANELRRLRNHRLQIDLFQDNIITNVFLDLFFLNRFLNFWSCVMQKKGKSILLKQSSLQIDCKILLKKLTRFA